MTKQRFADMDPFADSFDGYESIGEYIDTDGACTYEETIGALKANAKVSVKPADKKAADKKAADKKAADKKAADKKAADKKAADKKAADKKAADKKAADKKVTPSKAAVVVRKATNTVKDVDNAIDKIRNVTRSPVTLAAIAATATIVPVGTVVAGVATAGLAVAEGIMSVAKPIAKAAQKVGSFFKKVFSGSDKKKNAKRRASLNKAVDKLLKDNKGMSKKDATKAVLAFMLKKIKVMTPDARVRLIASLDSHSDVKEIDAPKAVVAKQIAAPKVVITAEQSAKNLTLASTMLAKIMVLADKGDKKAQAELAAFQILARPDNIKNASQIKSMTGSASKEIIAIGYEEKFIASAIKKALEMKKTIQSLESGVMTTVQKAVALKKKQDNAKIQKQVADAAKKAAPKLAASIKKAQIVKPASKTLTGVLVTPDRKLSKKQTFKLGSGKNGWLIDSEGRASRGVWG